MSKIKGVEEPKPGTSKDAGGSEKFQSGSSSDARGWLRGKSENRFFNTSASLGTGFTKQTGTPQGRERWHSTKAENKFFGPRSGSRQEEHWRTDRSSNKFLGERSAAAQGLNSEILKWSSNSHGEKKNTKKASSKRHVTFDVSDLLTQEPEWLITFLVENLMDFVEFLAPPLPPNTVVQLVFVIEKICLPKANVKFANVILSRIQRNFMQQLDTYLMKLSLDEKEDMAQNEAFWENPESFWNSLLRILESIINRLQKAATQYLPRVVKASLVAIKFHSSAHGVCVAESVTKKLYVLSCQLKNLKKISEYNEDDAKGDYQTINVYPDPSEVLTRKKPFIRQNVIDGSYMSVEHYLDTHFRLLREDFLAPLREAICTYKDSLKNNNYVKITEFRIYTNAQFMHGYNDDSKCDLSYIGNYVRRNTYKMLHPGVCKQKYVYDEPFMPGSLLCFSSDNFKTMFFGVTIKWFGTSKNLIDVRLLEDIPFLYIQQYTMLECTNYFNTYYSVLKALQNFSTINFPMEKYIVNVTDESKPPIYLTDCTRFTIDDFTFIVLDYETWPSKAELQLNEMQYDAFKHALTSKFAVIQGPPGTGKTHLGLKIAQTLIKNCEAWGFLENFSDSQNLNNDNLHLLNYDYDFFDDEDSTYRLLGVTSSLGRRNPSGPILIIAYTNHALDQFLEGLLPYTQEIIRIGHQTKNKKISKFTFSGLKRDGNVLENYYDRIETTLVSKERLLSELESALCYTGIFDIQKFAAVIPELQASVLYKWPSGMVIAWLLGCFSTEQERKDRWETTNEISNDSGQFQANKDLRIPTSQNYILTVSDLRQFAIELGEKLNFKDSVDVETMFEDWDYIEEIYNQTWDNIKYLQWRLQHSTQHTNLYESQPVNAMGDPMELSYNERWILYFHWLACYIQYLKKALKRNHSTLLRIWEELEQYKQREDSKHVCQAMVVGMTTSGAAKYRHLLENLKSRIVIVEEAAEVLESHIVISLTQHCQHLILIGDHQQLRPSTADYQIEKQYQLGISLFERMVRNRISYSTLGVQHRMRPEISRLIVPAIYPSLENHSSVNELADIEGIKHSVFFVTHSHPEVKIGTSRRNPHEAKYAIALARHLILQGNDPSEITILTTYKGQMHEIKDEQKNSTYEPLQKVRVDVVDNFQGEENHLILLSLVRSNNQGNIGFLRIENRVCVALSRAKRGFYMIGNMDVLSESSKIWPKVKEVLENNQQIGHGLQLMCQKHPENMIVAVESEDFLKVPDGGCHLPCNADLKCGHICTRKCHVIDTDHSAFQCMESCTKILCEKDHKCLKKCWEKCGNCQVLLEQNLPCGHQQMVPCFMKIEDFKCLTLVETLLRCGHTVNKPCFEDKISFRCPIEVEVVDHRCGHLVKKKCHQPLLTVQCETIVIVNVACGHHYESQCYRKREELKKPCWKLCSKVLDCGHVCSRRCHYDRDRTHSTSEYQCQEKCIKSKRGCKADHKCNLLCCEPCEPCEEDIEVTLPCGHHKIMPCPQSDRKSTCNQLCQKTKPCGHVCYAKCHALCDSQCLFKVSRKFPNCKHRIKVPCSEDLVGKVCLKCAKKNSKKVNNRKAAEE